MIILKADLHLSVESVAFTDLNVSFIHMTLTVEAAFGFLSGFHIRSFVYVNANIIFVVGHSSVGF